MQPEWANDGVVDWPAPAGVRAYMSRRSGGVSEGRFDSFNLGLHVGDNPQRVRVNRQRWAQLLGAETGWLNQVHGARVVNETALLSPEAAAADGVWSNHPLRACSVLVADCLPVLLASLDAPAVAAAHAGWRGLAAGVIKQTVQTLCQEGGCTPARLTAWLGPCIGPRCFEVGDEVRDAFPAEGASRFNAHRRQDGSAAWLCDLAGLATDQLHQLGVRHIVNSGLCTVESSTAFFSYRRDGVTGRMAASVLFDR
jgi:polyphenol oxidase